MGIKFDRLKFFFSVSGVDWCEGGTRIGCLMMLPTDDSRVFGPPTLGYDDSGRICITWKSAREQ